MRRAVLAACLALSAALPAAGEDAAAPGTAISNQFLIRLADGADPEGTALALADAHGLALMRVYRRALPGFSALVPPLSLDALRRDLRVRSLGRDRTLGAGPLAAMPAAAGARQVALFDTGVSSGTTALSARLTGGVTFVGGEIAPAPDGRDDHGHGTAVSRQILESRPEAALWSVKVLGAAGSGSFSDLIAGLDWLLDTAAHPRLDAAYFSLGASCPVCRPDSSDEGVTILHEAVIAARDAGISLSASAEGLPGAFPEFTLAAAAIGPRAADQAFAFHDQYAFPNPVRGTNTATIRVQVGAADSVEVRIYDLSGRNVHSASDFTISPNLDDGNGKGAQHTYDHAWNVSGVGSGVYRYVVSAKKAGHNDIVKTGKLAVIK